MIKQGMFVRCPIDRQHPSNPRLFATGKVVSINEFNETAHIVFQDPFNHIEYFDYIPPEVEEAPLSLLDHCHLFKGSLVKIGHRKAKIIEYKKCDDDRIDYYIQDCDTKEYSCVKEEDLIASFVSGAANPVHQLSKYEFQNPCWYLGRQIVKDTMNILDNSIMGFRELAGCKIYLKAFQFNTIMRCLQSEYCRYMLADEVGLGKTIEACSILKIYLNNNTGKKVLIVVPQSLVSQWNTELLFKFGLILGENENNNTIYIKAIEDLNINECNANWEFVIVDEVHNYINNSKYNLIHELSVNTNNIILLSATPIQQRKNEYLQLLRLIQPNIYDSIDIDEFIKLVEKQDKISRLTHQLLDDIDSLKNELLPEIEEDDPHNNEDVIDQIDVIHESLDDLSSLINDRNLIEMISKIDTENKDLGLYDILVVISYICDNYQIERSIIRGRRSILGVYPKDENAEFSERKLIELQYKIGENENYYEFEAYRTLKEWIVQQQEELTTPQIEDDIKPLLESFFSSPWAYISELNRISNHKIFIPENVMTSAKRWEEDENEAIDNISDILDDIDNHPSRLIKIISYIESNLFGKKVVVFTDHIETFNVYYKALYNSFGEEVTCYSSFINQDIAESNIYRFQSDSKCKILICDKSGGEGRNLQIADFIIHIDLPWNINTIEQRIGRLDRMGRNVTIPVTSIVIHTEDSYEQQLFNFWNQGLNVFRQSLSGLEIIMNDINSKIINSIHEDFEFGLYRVIPELINEAEHMRETVQREQIFDTAALRFKPLYNQLNRLLTNYQFNENELFAKTMMSWASLAGFGLVEKEEKTGIVSFDEENFSDRSAQNAFLIPPNWDNYINKKQNEKLIKIQRGINKEQQNNVFISNKIISGSFDRDVAIKNDYIHFYAPGDEIFDCITDNALHSYKGMATAFAAMSSFDWKGFIYTFSIEPNERLLLDEGVPLHSLGVFRQYLASDIQVIPVPFSVYEQVPIINVINEHRRISQIGYFNESDDIEHLGRRGRDSGFMNIPMRYKCSNLDWFKKQYTDEKWENLVVQSSRIARKKASELFKNASNLSGAKEMIEQILSTIEARSAYYGTNTREAIDVLKHEYEIIYNSLCKPVIRIESACFMWLVNKNG